MSGLDYIHGAAAQEHISNMIHGNQIRELCNNYENQIRSLNADVFNLKNQVVSLKKENNELRQHNKSLETSLDNYEEIDKIRRDGIIASDQDVQTTKEAAVSLVTYINRELHKFIASIGNFTNPDDPKSVTVKQTLANMLAEDMTTKASFGLQSTFRNEIAKLFIQRFDENLKTWRKEHPDVVEIPEDDRMKVLGSALKDARAYLIAQARLSQKDAADAEAKKNGV